MYIVQGMPNRNVTNNQFALKRSQVYNVRKEIKDELNELTEEFILRANMIITKKLQNLMNSNKKQRKSNAQTRTNNRNNNARNRTNNARTTV